MDLSVPTGDEMQMGFVRNKYWLLYEDKKKWLIKKLWLAHDQSIFLISGRRLA